MKFVLGDIGIPKLLELKSIQHWILNLGCFMVYIVLPFCYLVVYMYIDSVRIYIDIVYIYIDIVHVYMMIVLYVHAYICFVFYVYDSKCLFILAIYLVDFQY